MRKYNGRGMEVKREVTIAVMEGGRVVWRREERWNGIEARWWGDTHVGREGGKVI